MVWLPQKEWSRAASLPYFRVLRHQNFAGVSLAVGVGRGGNYCLI